jgi:hypothetical protein
MPGSIPVPGLFILQPVGDTLSEIATAFADPLLARTTFHMFSCQRLGADEGWHPDDYSVDVSLCVRADLVPDSR